MQDLNTILQDAKAELRERVDLDDYPEDTIHEVADSNVPIHNATLFELAASFPALGVEEPEIGPAFDGRPTPINIIAANVYEALTEALAEELEAIRQEHEDEDEDETG